MPKQIISSIKTNNFNKKSSSNVDEQKKKQPAVVIKTIEDKIRENSVNANSNSAICKLCSTVINNKGQCNCEV